MTNGIKEIFDRARPTLNPTAHSRALLPERSHGNRCRVLGRGCAARRSTRGVRAHALLIGGAVAIGVAVGRPRVLLDVHWFTDVIGGLARVGRFRLCSIVFGGRLLRFGAPVAIAERELELADASVPTGSTQGARSPVGVEEQGVEEVEERARRGEIWSRGWPRRCPRGRVPCSPSSNRHRARGRFHAWCRTIGPDR